MINCHPKSFDRHIPRPYPPHRIVAPRRNPMTIAIGFTTVDGLLIGADTEYDDGYTKTYATKIFRIERKGSCQLMVASSGEEIATKSIVEDLERDIPMHCDLNGVKAQIKNALLNYFNSHIYPRPDLKDYVMEFVIAASTADSGLSLLKTHNTDVMESESYVFAGSGVLFEYLANIHYQKWIGHGMGKFLAVYMLKMAKKHCTGCGGDSEIYLWEKEEGRVERVNPREIVQIENMIEEFLPHIGNLLFSTSLECEESTARDFMDAFAGFLWRIRRNAEIQKARVQKIRNIPVGEETIES